MPRLQKHEGEELQLLKKVTPGLHTSHRDTQGTPVSPGRGGCQQPLQAPRAPPRRRTAASTRRDQAKRGRCGREKPS